jgi:hypothetical protein
MSEAECLFICLLAFVLHLLWVSIYIFCSFFILCYLSFSYKNSMIRKYAFYYTCCKHFSSIYHFYWVCRFEILSALYLCIYLLISDFIAFTFWLLLKKAFQTPKLFFKVVMLSSILVYFLCFKIWFIWI